MRNLIVFAACWLMISTLANGQFAAPEMKGSVVGTAARSEVKMTELKGVVSAENRSERPWMKSISKLAAYEHGAPSDLKNHKMKMNALKSKASIVQSTPSNARSAVPILGTNFLGNNLSQSTPTDNCLAISNGGKIVSSDNSTIAFYNENGSPILLNETHDDWFSDIASSLYLPSGIFDPRVIYDPVNDRFIFVILHGSSASTSKVLVCFSTSNNPAGSWNVYELSGNPLNDNSWFDYPNIGITGTDLVISGNLFYAGGGGFNQTIVYQVDKMAGYAGESLSYVTYNNLPEGNGTSFTVVPASHGQGSEYGPGMYMVSSHWWNSSYLNLYEITDSLGGNPSLNLNASFAVPNYQAPGDAVQMGSSELLNTNDTRMQHAFYLNGLIHAVHQVNYSAGYSGIAYYRIPVDNVNATQSARYGQSGMDYAFPSIASFGEEEIDQGVIVSFLSSSSNTYPGMKAVNCDNLMEWSDAITVRAGDSYIDHSYVSNVERWGDYSDLQRRHNSDTVEVWFGGCFGPNSHVWNTWIAQITGTYEPAPLPIAVFEADTLMGYETFIVQFSDSSLNDPDSWEWNFEGGNPATSIYQYPIVSFSDTGKFNVSLKVSNEFGSDSLMKEAYIEVWTTDTAPVIPAGIHREEGLENQVTVFPNPSTAYELFNIDIDNPEWSLVNVEILDVQGRRVKQLYADDLKPGLHRLTFNKLALDPGHYIIQVARSGQITQYEKIIVQ
ncbi:MAG: T9SS type A sorting domain-containing protein [Cryomorphaceae bacterium]